MAKLGLLAAAVCVALVFAGTALADRSVVTGYGGSQGTSIQNQVEGGSPSQPVGGEVAPEIAGSVETSSSNLPFTGLDLALIIGGGLALLALGVVLRRTTRAQGN